MEGGGKGEEPAERPGIPLLVGTCWLPLACRHAEEWEGTDQETSWYLPAPKHSVNVMELLELLLSYLHWFPQSLYEEGIVPCPDFKKWIIMRIFKNAHKMDSQVPIMQFQQ